MLYWRVKFKQVCWLLPSRASCSMRPSIAENGGESYKVVRFAKTSTRMYLSGAVRGSLEPENSSQVSGLPNARATVAVRWPSSSRSSRCSSFNVPLDAQSVDRSALNGQQLYQAACAACHGSDGRGQPVAVRGFDVDLPDFTDCGLTTPEADLDWLVGRAPGRRRLARSIA